MCRRKKLFCNQIKKAIKIEFETQVMWHYSIIVIELFKSLIMFKFKLKYCQKTPKKRFQNGFEEKNTKVLESNCNEMGLKLSFYSKKEKNRMQKIHTF